VFTFIVSQCWTYLLQTAFGPLQYSHKLGPYNSASIYPELGLVITAAEHNDNIFFSFGLAESGYANHQKLSALPLIGPILTDMSCRLNGSNENDPACWKSPYRLAYCGIGSRVMHIEPGSKPSGFVVNEVLSKAAGKKADKARLVIGTHPFFLFLNVRF
jgi:hypothetical protein